MMDSSWSKVESKFLVIPWWQLQSRYNVSDYIHVTTFKFVIYNTWFFFFFNSFCFWQWVLKKSHFKQFMHLVPNPQKRQVLFKLYYVFHLLKTCFTILFSFSHLKVQHGCFIFIIPGGNFEMKIGPGRAQESWMLASTIIWNTS